MIVSIKFNDIREAPLDLNNVGTFVLRDDMMNPLLIMYRGSDNNTILVKRGEAKFQEACSYLGIDGRMDTIRVNA